MFWIVQKHVTSALISHNLRKSNVFLQATQFNLQKSRLFWAWGAHRLQEMLCFLHFMQTQFSEVHVFSYFADMPLWNPSCFYKFWKTTFSIIVSPPTFYARGKIDSCITTVFSAFLIRRRFVKLRKTRCILHLPSARIRNPSCFWQVHTIAYVRFANTTAIHVNRNQEWRIMDVFSASWFPSTIWNVLCCACSRIQGGDL